jgi:predicted anti-sigma-YlaC factor YlaD
MTCDEVELEVVCGGEPSAAAREHLSGCEQCRAFQASSARVLADAALPAVSAEEKASQQSLAPRVLHQWKKQDRQRSVIRRVAGLAMAACLGAAVASAALLPRLQEPQPVDLPEWSVVEPELVASSDTEDELETFEVSWPSP